MIDFWNANCASALRSLSRSSCGSSVSMSSAITDSDRASNHAHAPSADTAMDALQRGDHTGLADELQGQSQYQPSWPHKDFALEGSTSSCDRCIQATETENSFCSQSEPARPPRKFPHGSIKQKTSAVATVRDFLGVRHAEHRESYGQRGEFGTLRIRERSIGCASASLGSMAVPLTPAYSRSVNTTDR